MSGKDPSFEIVLGYFLGKPEDRRKIFGLEEIEEIPLEEIADDDMVKEELEKAENLANEKKDVQRAEEKQRKKEAKELAALEKKMHKDSLDLVKQEAEALAIERKEAEKQTEIAAEKAEEKAQEAAKKEALALVEKKATEQKVAQERLAAEAEKAEATKVAELEKQRLDSIAREQEKAAVAEAQRIAQIKQDSIDRTAREVIEEAARQKQTEVAEAQDEVDKPKAGEKYEEVKTEDGLIPGYYLIANVFGTKKYFDAFMADLEKKGLQPKSFLRSKNKFHYVFLERYQTMGEARAARDSNYNGRYPEKTWIFRVKAE